jgi:hypothetical protein
MLPLLLLIGLSLIGCFTTYLLAWPGVLPDPGYDWTVDVPTIFARERVEYEWEPTHDTRGLI